MTNHTCYTCGTDDFESGSFSDVSTPPEVLGTIGPNAHENLFCLSCAAKYEAEGTATFEIMLTIEQLAIEHRWYLAGIGTN